MVPTIVIVSLVVAANMLFISATATTHIVGDHNGWSLFTDSNNWPRTTKFNVGDVLVFTYNRDVHNVMQVRSSEAYEHCLKDKEHVEKLFSSGNDSIVLSEAGQHWFICGVEDHCLNHQKLMITVLPSLH